MSDKLTSWMPFWLASYIFIIGSIFMVVSIQAFCVMAYDAAIDCTWQIGAVMAATASLPWVWYFTYIGHRYLDKIPRLYYLFVAFPLLNPVLLALARETLYEAIHSFSGSVYAIHIGWEVVLQLAIISFIIYELCARWNVYAEFIAQIGRVLDDA